MKYRSTLLIPYEAVGLVEDPAIREWHCLLDLKRQDASRTSGPHRIGAFLFWQLRNQRNAESKRKRVAPPFVCRSLNVKELRSCE
jgi:hypothetical protein